MSLQDKVNILDENAFRAAITRRPDQKPEYEYEGHEIIGCHLNQGYITLILASDSKQSYYIIDEETFTNILGF